MRSDLFTEWAYELNNKSKQNRKNLLKVGKCLAHSDIGVLKVPDLNFSQLM